MTKTDSNVNFDNAGAAGNWTLNSNMNYVQQLWLGAARCIQNLWRMQGVHIRLASTEQLIVITAERQGHGVVGPKH